MLRPFRVVRIGTNTTNKNCKEKTTAALIMTVQPMVLPKETARDIVYDICKPLDKYRFDFAFFFYDN